MNDKSANNPLTKCECDATFKDGYGKGVCRPLTPHEHDVCEDFVQEFRLTIEEWARTELQDFPAPFSTTTWRLAFKLAGENFHDSFWRGDDFGFEEWAFPNSHADALHMHAKEYGEMDRDTIQDELDPPPAHLREPDCTYPYDQHGNLYRRDDVL